MSESEVLQELEKLRAQVSTLEAQKAELQAAAAKSHGGQMLQLPTEFAVSPKGCLGINNIWQRPIIFYREVYERLLAEREQIEAYIKEHDAELVHAKLLNGVWHTPWSASEQQDFAKKSSLIKKRRQAT